MAFDIPLVAVQTSSLMMWQEEHFWKFSVGTSKSTVLFIVYLTKPSIGKIVSNDMMVNKYELEKLWKEAAVA